MSSATTEKKAGWFTGLIDGAARAFAFGANAGTEGGRAEKTNRKSEKAGRKIEMKGLTLQVQRLVADGHTAAEIARRTALSQDTIALLLHLTPAGPDETAAKGTIFRVAQADRSR
jgi:hypothetical protein